MWMRHGEIADREPGLYRVIDSAELSHGKGMKSYLIFMAVRLLEMKRVLKDTGSIYMHCDPTASHYLKLVMDVVFGRQNFRNEIVWKRDNSAGKVRTGNPKTWGTITDALFFYTGSKNVSVDPFIDISPDELIKKFPKVDENGERYNTATKLFNTPAMLAKKGPNQDYEWKGFNPEYGWVFIKSRLEEEYEKGNVVIREDGKIERRTYAKNYRGKPAGSLWVDIPIASKKERTGYPTQKPLALLERIIKASSNSGDIVLDPFCGCATTCVAAESLGREWVGIDLSPLAVKLVNQRLRDHHGLFGQAIHRTDVPVRTDLGELPNYRTHKHALYGKQEGLCNGCKVQFPFRNMTHDHIVPQVKGGSHHIDNLQLLCGACNSLKGENEQAYLIARLKEQNFLD